MRKIWVVLVLAIYLIPITNLHAQTSNAGFVPGNIWYSKDPFEDGEKIKIYTVIFNHDARELLGTVVFFDGSTFLGKKDFTAPAKGVKDVSIDWTVSAGTHDIFAKIENSKFLISQGKYEDVYLLGSETQKSSRTVSKKLPEKPDPVKAIDEVASNIIDTGTKSIENVGKYIDGKIPDMVTNPIVSTIGAVDSLRERAGVSLKDSRNQTRKELDSMKEAETKEDVSDKAQNTSSLTKPFKYVKLSAAAILATAFNNKFIFYGLLLGIIFFLFRFLWRLAFR